MSEYDKQSVKIYLSYHVSELDKLMPKTKQRWYEGQELYNSNKQS